QFKVKKFADKAAKKVPFLKAESSIDAEEIAGASCGGALHWAEFDTKKTLVDTYFLAWTTTPWTLPSNTALAVGRDIEYVLVKTFNQYTFEHINIVLAKVLLQKNFGKKYAEGSEEDLKNYTSEAKVIPYQILAEFTGEELVGSEYEQLIPWFLPAE